MVRTATQDDYEALDALRAQTCALHSAGRPDRFKPGFPPSHRARLQTMLDDPEGYDVLVYEEDGQVTGYLVLQAIHQADTEAMYGGDYAFILEVGVDEAARGRGAGRRLMEAAAARARQRGFSEIRLEVWEFNQRAIAFYEKLGYATDARSMSIPLS